MINASSLTNDVVLMAEEVPVALTSPQDGAQNLSGDSLEASEDVIMVWPEFGRFSAIDLQLLCRLSRRTTTLVAFLSVQWR